MLSSSSVARLRTKAEIVGLMHERRASSQRRARALGPTLTERADSGRTLSRAPSVGGPVCAPNAASGTESGGNNSALLTKSRLTDDDKDGDCASETSCGSQSMTQQGFEDI